MRIIALDPYPVLLEEVYSELSEEAQVIIVTDLAGAVQRVVRTCPDAVLVPERASAPGSLSFDGALFERMVVSVAPHLRGRFIRLTTAESALDPDNTIQVTPENERDSVAVMRGRIRGILEREGRCPEAAS